MNNLYETFHENSKSIKLIPSDNDFTYGNFLKFIKLHINNHFEKKSIKILDYGCGVGNISFNLAKSGYQVIGVDISKNAVNGCKHTNKIISLDNIEFKVYDNISNMKDQFDVIILSEVIEHIDNDLQFLKDSKKKLNHGGLIILSTPSINAPLYKLNLLNEFDKRVGHKRRYSTEILQKLIDEAGLDLITIYKNEGIIRNSLFNISIFGLALKIIQKVNMLGRFVLYMDSLTISIFGESDYYLVAIKK